MSALFDTLVRFFEDEDWTFHADAPVVHFPFKGEYGRWTCRAKAREEQRQVLVLSLCPVNAPVARRAEAGEYLHRANFGLVRGNFELDYRDGEIRFKTSADVEEAMLQQPTWATLRALVHMNLAMTDRYLPGLLRVLYGAENPARALARVEGDDLPDEEAVDEKNGRWWTPPDLPLN